jgi:hypothetical protein
MANLMTPQEEARERKEAENKKELDAFKGSGNLAQDALAA